jgi:hypothetical protein
MSEAHLYLWVPLSKISLQLSFIHFTSIVECSAYLLFEDSFNFFENEGFNRVC